jgi:hypothetical protein
VTTRVGLSLLCYIINLPSFLPAILHPLVHRRQPESCSSTIFPAMMRVADLPRKRRKLQCRGEVDRALLGDERELQFKLGLTGL